MRAAALLGAVALLSGGGGCSASPASRVVGRAGARGPVPAAAGGGMQQPLYAGAGAAPKRHVAVTEVTSESVWPAPVFNSNVANVSWVHIAGSDGMGATGPDCPYTQHGPDGSLAECENGCNSAGAGVCTDINWNEAIHDCVFRRCTDPLKPALSPADGYTVYAIVRLTITYFGVNAATFKFVTRGFADDVLEAAVLRARKAAFAYGDGAASSLPELIPSLTIDVTTSDDALRLGVDESYTLTVAPGAAGSTKLVAPTVYGALHGLETFFQLLSFNLTDSSYMMATTSIVDSPRFPFRGVMIDTSRHFMSVSVIKQVVDMMAAVKLNSLSIHLTDDQSWPLVSPSWPELSLQSAYSNHSHVYTPAMVADLVRYARLRGVRVLPELDTPSHFGALYAAYPQFAAQASDGGLCMVDPSREEVFSFLADLFRDANATFVADMFRIGGDEFQGCWQDCPAVMAWIAQKWGAKGTIYDAYHYYERRLIDLVRGNGKTTMAWLDIEGFPDANSNETWAANYSDVTLNVWTGCYSGSWQDDVSRFTHQLNGTVVVSGPFYITQQSNQPDAPHFTWQQMYQTDLHNFTGNTTAARARVLGGELCVWDDAAGTDSGDLAVQVTPFLFGVSEAFWSPQSLTSGVAPDQARAHIHRCRLIQRGYASHPIFAFSTWCPREYEWAGVPATT